MLELSSRGWRGVVMTPKTVAEIERIRRHASTDDITLEPDDPKPPSPEVAELLQAHIDHLPPR